jgi:hypothetical protein
MFHPRFVEECPISAQGSRAILRPGEIFRECFELSVNGIAHQ